MEGERPLSAMSKEELLELAREHGFRGLEGLSRAELSDLLRRALTRAASRKRVGEPRASCRRAAPARRPEPPPAFELDERISLLVRDGRTLYAYWNAANGELAALLEAGRDLRLRLYDVTDAGAVAGVVEMPLEPWARDF